MTLVYLLLLAVAAICFAAAAFRREQVRVNLVAAGLLAWVLVPLIQTLRTVGN